MTSRLLPIVYSPALLPSVPSDCLCHAVIDPCTPTCSGAWFCGWSSSVSCLLSGHDLPFLSAAPSLRPVGRALHHRTHDCHTTKAKYTGNRTRGNSVEITPYQKYKNGKPLGLVICRNCTNKSDHSSHHSDTRVAIIVYILGLEVTSPIQESISFES